MIITTTVTRAQDDEDTRELLLRLLPMSASLAGLSVGAVTLFRLTECLRADVAELIRLRSAANPGAA